MSSFFGFVSLMNPGSQSRNIMPSIRFSSYEEVILHKVGVFRKESLITKKKKKKNYNNNRGEFWY